MFASLSKFLSVALKHADKTLSKPPGADKIMDFHALSPSVGVTIDEDIEFSAFSVPRSNLTRGLRVLLANNPPVSGVGSCREDRTIETSLLEEPSRGVRECPQLPEVLCEEIHLGSILEYLDPILLKTNNACKSVSRASSGAASNCATAQSSVAERYRRRLKRRQRRESNRILDKVRTRPPPPPVPISDFANPKGQTRPSEMACGRKSPLWQSWVPYP